MTVVSAGIIMWLVLFARTLSSILQDCTKLPQRHLWRGRSLSVQDSFGTYTFGTFFFGTASFGTLNVNIGAVTFSTYKILVQSTSVHKCQFRYKHLRYKSTLVLDKLKLLYAVPVTFHLFNWKKHELKLKVGNFFGRPFVKRFALWYQTTVCPALCLWRWCTVPKRLDGSKCM